MVVEELTTVLGGAQDLWGGTFLLTPPSDCECVEMSPGFAEQTGNFVVHDATP
jgi:hypothetical protein